MGREAKIPEPSDAYVGYDAQKGLPPSHTGAMGAYALDGGRDGHALTIPVRRSSA
jgi:hypothetical protein